MIKNKTLQDLLYKDMTRKQFLQVVGAAILGIIGFTNFLNNLDKFAKTQTAHKPSKEIVSGYGSSAYGR
jgi:hypothetical protein